MKNDQSLVRASDISAWVYCNRAWWLARVQGAEHEQPQQLERGATAHERHGRAVLAGEKARQVGLILMASAALFATFAVILWLFA
jgi:CRISPR/Cas system-associated exonuclease Cas4 (RecB family)